MLNETFSVIFKFQTPWVAYRRILKQGWKYRFCSWKWHGHLKKLIHLFSRDFSVRQFSFLGDPHSIASALHRSAMILENSSAWIDLDAIDSINCSVAKWKLDLIFVVAFKLIHHVTFPRLFSHGDNLFTILAPPNLQYLGTHGFFPGRHHDLPTPGWASETYQKSCHKTNFWWA